MCATHLTISNVETSRFSSIPRLNNGTVLFFFHFWLATHCQPDRFSHIARGHPSLCSYCQETLPHKLSKPNEQRFLHPSYWRKEKRDIKNNPINNNCLHHVVIRTAKGERRNKLLETTMKTCHKQSAWQTTLSSTRLCLLQPTE